MGKKDPRVDAYIAKAADFAKPILQYARKMVHAGCPEIVETIKWGCPHFMLEKNVALMAAFKKHCMFRFWRNEINKALKEGYPRAFDKETDDFVRMTRIDELPKEALFKKLVKQAAELDRSGVPRPRPAPKPRRALPTPADLQAALRKNKAAQATFTSLSPSRKREYIEWIADAKRDETRSKRLKEAIELLSDGKSLNWKYERKKAKAR